MKLAFFTLVLVLLIAPVAFADGMIHVYDPDMSYWKLQSEESQVAVINFENGIEKMIIAVKTGNLQGQKAVWVFPVPAKPESTKIDITESFPILNGVDFETKKNTALGGALIAAGMSQVYLAPLMIILLITGGTSGMGMSGQPTDRGSLGQGDTGITVFEHLEKNGLTTEVVTAKNGKALYDYLAGKDLGISTSSKPLLDEYVGKDYSFVVSWVSSSQQLTSATLGLMVSFPTEKIYFPLKPTRVYESSEIPILVYVLGHVTPVLYPGIENKTKTDYFYYSDYYSRVYDAYRMSNPDFDTVPKELSSFFGSNALESGMKYTKIKITAPSSSFTEDLWVENSAPAKVAFGEFIVENSLAFGIILFIIISCLASLLAGAVIFGKDKPNLKKFALFGLANFLTLLGFTALAYFLKIDEKFAKSKRKVKEKASWGRVILTTSIVAGVPTLPFLLLSIATLFFNPLLALILLLFVFAFFFIIALPFVWGFYNNNKVMKFAVVFSLFFLLITVILGIGLMALI